MSADIKPNDKNTLYQGPIGFCKNKQSYLKIIIDGTKWKDDNYTTGLLERVYDDQQVIINRMKEALENIDQRIEHSDSYCQGNGECSLCLWREEFKDVLPK